MTENKLKSMAENNKFDELMNNKQELERLSKIESISEVLDVLNKYGYNGTKQDLGRDLFEILQGLSEDDLQNISGGRILNKKHLAGLMGGLTMMGAMGLTTSAQVENQSTVKPKPETSFLNKVDKKVFGVGVGSLLVGGFLVEGLNLLFRKPKIEYKDKIAIQEKIVEKIEYKDNTDIQEKIVEKIENDPNFTLTDEYQTIYKNTKELCDMILKYVENYNEENKKMPERKLNIEDSTHQGILKLIKNIRTDWLKVYENNKGCELEAESKNKVTGNEQATLQRTVYPVEIGESAVEDLFYGLPVGNTWIRENCVPDCLQDCTDDETMFLGLIIMLHFAYQEEFASLKKN